MSRPPRPGDASTLTARVEQRVAEAGQALTRRRRATRPRNRSVASPAAPVPMLERASLAAVFRELGDTHRRYRQRTGQSGTPALRAAARAFKDAPSLPALVTVATFLDELGLLAW
jgi:hypothetical protein